MYVQCSLLTDNDNIITEPFTAVDVEIAVNENVEIAVNEVSPRSTQSIERATMSPMINALTNATVAAENTEVPAPRRTTMIQMRLPIQSNLVLTFHYDR